MTAVALASASSPLVACGSAGEEATPEQAQRRYGGLVLERRTAASDAPNVVLISLDDQNDWLSFLANHAGTRTPNIDALAAESVVFKHAYTPAPMCDPARAAVFYGQPPHLSGVYNHSKPSSTAFDELVARQVSVVDWFWAAGYQTAVAGKVARALDKRADVGRELTLMELDPQWRSPYTGQPIEITQCFTCNDYEVGGAGIDFGPTGRPMDRELDVINAEWIVGELGTLEPPFMLVFGTDRPHEPWRVPQEFLDQHPIQEVVVPELVPEDLDDLSAYVNDVILSQQERFEILRATGLWEEAVQAYQAASSFADHSIGIVLDALARSPHGENTVVVLFSDNGFHLGEKMHLHKFTLWERACRVPLLVRAPGALDPLEVDAPVSTIDVGPTLADICGVDAVGPHEGRSLLPVLDDPGRARDRPPLSTWLPGNHAVRRDNWRFIRYKTGDRELYDIDSDPDERTNLAGRPEFGSLETELASFLPD